MPAPGIVVMGVVDTFGQCQAMMQTISSSTTINNIDKIQGVRTQKFMFQFALTDINIQARFGLRVVGEYVPA